MNRADDLRAIFDAGLEAVQPAAVLPPHLPEPPKGRLIVLSCGKAAGRFAQTAEAHYLDRLGLDPKRLEGIAVARTGYGCPTRRIEMVEAGHPLPDEAGLRATLRTLVLAESAGRDDLVLCLVSGGGSANWVAPVKGVGLEDKRAVSDVLLKASVPIGRLNAVRKHLSRIKGGRLQQAIHPAPSLTLAISDVPGDDPEVIASGPTVADPTTLAEARAIAAAFRDRLPASVLAALEDAGNETLKPGAPALARAAYRLIARPADMIAAAARKAEALGYRALVLGVDLEGEARSVARIHAKEALAHARNREKVALISGGELTVTVTGDGEGGPNQEYATALAIALAGSTGISALAADSDGTDGGSSLADDPAGGLVDGQTLQKAARAGVDAQAALAANDSRRFLQAAGALFTPGPTGTNANDLRVICVDTAGAIPDKT
ncbi:MAG: glycerate kinase [Hyphomicrobiaceae bacterium]|nr:glycerate kinase [Hyphomicrobiaceae bacterium]